MSSTLHVLVVSANSHGPLTLNAAAKLGYEVNALDAMKGETRTPEFMAKNPYHCCPTLEEEGMVLWESNAILRHMAEKGKLEQWYPTDLQRRAKINQAMDYRQNTFYKDLGPFCYPALGFGAAVDAEEMAKRQATFTATCEDFAKNYLADGKFVGGEAAPTIADLSFVPTLLFTAVHADFELPAALKAYQERFEAAVPEYTDVRAPLDGYLGYLASQK